MVLQFQQAWTPETPAGDWNLPGKPAFAESRSFERLLHDLGKYVRDEVAGRSFLIAGHRGAGKTATVAEAIRRLRADRLRNAADEAPSLGRRHRLQRPLMVKLVGQSLIAPPPRQQEIEAQRRAKQEQPAAAADGAGAGDAAEPDPAAPARPPDQVENALVHITIALYRAFATEVALGFATHAAAYAERDRDDRLELASQLALELDGTPDLALLRSYWDRLGRLDRGVLWPARVDQTMREQELARQGMRELVALASAAQAFEVCSGAVTYKVTNQETASNEQKAESKLDVKELINRLGAIGAGALAGGVVGASQGSVQGVATGVLVWLASGLTLNWSATRQRKSDRKLDYTFLRDRSIETLDRDLPLVIERIRDAGLAPVFVIDELDKLDKPAATIRKIINRLKHLVADYGFFCFLTDRAYFDEIERSVANAPYPTVHTYFSQRVLVINRPTDLFNYVRGLLTPPPPIELEPTEATAIGVFALVIVYRSKLNFTDMTRELSRYAMRDDALSEKPEALLGRPDFVLAAAIQLAIEQVLIDQPMANRFETDPSFEHLVIDSLYYIPRVWEDNVGQVLDTGYDALRHHLLGRRKPPEPDDDRNGAAGPDAELDAASPPAPAGAGHEDKIVDADMVALLNLVDRLAGYLEDFETLRTRLRERALSVPDPRLRELTYALVDVVPAGGMLRRAPGEQRRFTFIRDEAGLPRGEEESPPVAVADEAPPTAETAVTLLENLRTLLEVAELSVDDLVRARLLPATLNQALLLTSIDDLTNAAANPDYEFKDRGQNGRDRFELAFNSYGPRIADALILLADIQVQFDVAEPRRIILSRISRYFAADLVRIRPTGHRVTEDPQLAGTPASVRVFTGAYRDLLGRGVDAERPRMALFRPWGPWRERLLGYLCRGQPARSLGIDYNDLAAAARNEAPGNLFGIDFSELDLIDWSKVVLAALRDSEGRIRGPAWLLFAGLKAIGFSQPAMMSLASAAPPIVPVTADDQAAINEFMRSAGERPPGFLHVYPDDGAVARPLEIPRVRPILAVGYAELHAYMDALNRLAECGVIQGGTEEVSQPPA